MSWGAEGRAGLYRRRPLPSTEDPFTDSLPVLRGPADRIAILVVRGDRRQPCMAGCGHEGGNAEAKIRPYRRRGL